MRRTISPPQPTDDPGPTDSDPLTRRWSSAHRHAERFRLPAVPTLVVAPHPDDETLLAGGLIASQRSRGVDVHVLAITDGEDAYGAADSALAERRRDEQLAALEELGVGPESVVRLGVPDGSVAEHAHAVVDAIAAFDRVGLVVAPWTGDFHSDHEAAGAAARDAVERSGSALIFGLFWTWHRREPDDLATERMMRLELDADARRRRRLAIEHHRSQFARPDSTTGPGTADPEQHDAPQLTAGLVRPLDWDAEYFVSPRPRTDRSIDVDRRPTGLATGVPPVTSRGSGVQT